MSRPGRLVAAVVTGLVLAAGVAAPASAAPLRDQGRAPCDLSVCTPFPCPYFGCEWPRLPW